jgi:hypothetical protein
MPDAASIVAMEVLLLLHVPPAGVLLSVVVIPAQVFAEPVIAAGSGFTDIMTALAQPVDNV